MLHLNVLLQHADEHGGGYVQAEGADHGTAQQAREHGDKGQRRQGDQQRDDARQHQQLQRVKAQRADGVDLFIGFHGADLGSEGTGGTPGHQDGRQQHAKLTQEGEGHQVHGENGSAKGLQHGSAQKGDDRADHKGKQGHDGDGIDPGLFNLGRNGGQAPARRTQQVTEQAAESQADKAEQLAQIRREYLHLGADTLQQNHYRVELGAGLGVRLGLNVCQALQQGAALAGKRLVLFHQLLQATVSEQIGQ